MSTVPFTFRLETELKKNLDLEVKDCSSFYLVSQEVKKQAVERAVLEADKGVFVSQKAVHEWMDSWDMKNEIPKPKADIFLNV